ncbi:unnamed protein product [Oikopleura dioica]|uniref:Uncharacterized protein n=1 Tax=Oikopleura dioica TaxID=34765 RepID=E4Y6A5_OIKDI|nr:unnamed protein product [Oikopleura dioica]
MTAAFSNFYEDATKKLSIRRNKKKRKRITRITIMSEPETGQLRGDAPAGESPIAYTNATCSLAEDFYQPVDSIYYFRDGDGKIVDIYDSVAPVDTQVVFECKVKGYII